MEDRIIRNISINLERLRRQHNINKQKYDVAAMYDLSHILRIWVDMKQDVQLFLNEKSPLVRFESYIITKNLKRLIGSNEYMVSGIGGVSTLAGKGEYFSINRINMSNCSGIINVQGIPEIEAKVWEIIIINGYTDRDLAMKVAKSKNYGFAYKRVSYLEWMQAEVVRIYYKNDQKESIRSIIPREILIKRVANFLGGSHPEGMEDADNQFDAPIEELLNYNIVGLPAPYYILLKSAEDILNNISIP